MLLVYYGQANVSLPKDSALKLQVFHQFAVQLLHRFAGEKDMSPVAKTVLSGYSAASEVSQNSNEYTHSDKG